MRAKHFLPIVVISLVAVIGLTGCKHPSAGSRGQAGAGGPGSGDIGGIPPLGSGDGTGLSSGARPDGTWGARGQFAAVYFDFDSTRVGPSEVAKLEAVAAALRGNSHKLVVEGHADERGTAEYNRALGERRALACREELARLGIAADRISTISYGEDRPAELGHDEGSWAKNRRCEFITVTQ